MSLCYVFVSNNTCHYYSFMNVNICYSLKVEMKCILKYTLSCHAGVTSELRGQQKSSPDHLYMIDPRSPCHAPTCHVCHTIVVPGKDNSSGLAS